MQNQSYVVLWIDLCELPSNSIPEESLRLLDDFKVIRLSKSQYLDTVDAVTNPHLACFDFDCPSLQSLRLLRRFRQNHPNIPVIMLSKHRSASLVIWAFRVGVSDYLIKPEEGNGGKAKLLTRLVPLVFKLVQNPQSQRQSLHASPLSSKKSHSSKVVDKPSRTQSALAYVTAHFADKLDEVVIARQCGMTTHVFSKVFHKEHGLPFRDYVMSYRVEQAKELLTNPKMNITDIAMAIGFYDTSGFCRIFKRYVGQTPSVYRNGGHEN